MDGPAIHTFTLTDGKGREHSYLVTEHPAGEGLDIFFQLLGLGAPTLLGLAGAALKSESAAAAIAGALGAESDDDAPAFGANDLASMLADLDLERVGQEVGKAMATGKAPALTRAILARTRRDGRPMSGADFDLAYQANYYELLMALWKVCQINRFFPEFSTSPSSAPARESRHTLPPPPAG